MDTTITADSSKYNDTNNNRPAKSLSSSWKLEGDYFEACNCDLVCPCTFFQEP
jgi:hypothetical protein